MMSDASSDSSSLVAVAVAIALSLSVTVYIASDISGGHVNPAVTFGRAVGGHITIPTTIFYWMSQMLGYVMACLVLKTTTVGQQVPVHAIQHEMTGFGAAILEGVMTFALVYTVCAFADPMRGAIGSIGPLAIGFIVGANVLASGPFTGGSMNPAISFGAAVNGGGFKNQAVYWIRPLVGAAIAGIVYDNVVFPADMPDPIRGVSDGVGI
ncbi:hypothetical protein BUALT_Bualt01G0204300 [Buddleja alternifolia]|uniref:Aquaporin n=1 Tax=Buddleja alternifolia TaxID=168488 RepID=A0AAV6YJ62_9LAMI|nr:hypothetical protein BUALT_Bualt01G0204300 [Buddleja alternifolia]